MRPTWRLPTLLVALAALLPLSACGPEACTTMAAVSGITIDDASVLAAHPHTRLTLRVCVASDCRTLRSPHLVGAQFVPFGGSALASGRPVAVRVSITAAGGRRIFHGQAEVTPRKEQVNGPGCSPTTWVGAVVATGTGTLTPAAG